ncbi:MAG: beta-L-arabinofuranosidase domain-containing protein, partial [Chitinophagaceae bacterium]
MFKIFLSACITFLSNVVYAQHQVFDKTRLLLEPFEYNEVKLQQSPLKKQFEEVIADYLAIPNDDILKGFRQRAGLPTNNAKDMGGWYTNDLFHVFGQFISGMSKLYAVSGYQAMKIKVNTLVDEWAKTIDKDGYFFYTKKPNAPQYVYEKMIGGLVDNYVFTGNKDALKYLSVITDWAIKNLNRDRLYGQTASEWYTLSENLYRAYAVTKDKKYLDFGKIWDYTDYWNVHAKGEKVNSKIRHHAYSHLNTLSSAAAAYMVSGDDKYKTIIKNGYEYFQNEQTFATGGYEPNERFLAKDDLINVLQNTHNSFEEQCGSWAIFKLSKHLIETTGDAKYGDWIEKMTINGIGADIPMTKDGKVHY